MLIENTHRKEYLQPTPTIDFNSDIVQDFIRDNSREHDPVAERVIALYYAVRDQVRYDPYTPSETPADYAASRTLETMRGWCVPKSILDGRQHMEYLNFRGTYADLPFEEMTRDFAKLYPNWQDPVRKSDFDREVVLETSA